MLQHVVQIILIENMFLESVAEKYQIKLSSVCLEYKLAIKISSNNTQ